MPFVLEDVADVLMYFMTPLSLGMLAFLVYALVDTFKGAIQVGDKGIVHIHPLGVNALRIEDVKGYEVTDRSLKIYPKRPEIHKKITLSNYKYVANATELQEWITSNFVDIEAQVFEGEYTDIMSNHDYGVTVQERQAYLKKAKLAANILNWFGSILAALLFFEGPFYFITCCLTIVFIPIILIVIVVFKGALRIEEKQGSAYASIHLGLMLPSIALAIVALQSFDIFDYNSLWGPLVLLTVVLLAIVILVIKQSTKQVKRLSMLIGVLMSLTAYSYGTLVLTNCLFDNHIPERFSAKVVSKRKHTSSKGGTSYYITLNAWGTLTEPKETSVGATVYNSTKEQDVMYIYLHEGLFDIPWYYIRKVVE
ncbi:hypothetical protein Y10_01870 [Neptunitalea sp. Y10]|uniref:DUF2207 domain-containing protein n=2 Tax=Neptunitalea lumnitzerae TaxID=2965509 RepID=A0ABQ5MEK9_9FLAO|nr:hypothetical protein Y10_01870 [Neptunitalea sp. Y10]